MMYNAKKRSTTSISHDRDILTASLHGAHEGRAWTRGLRAGVRLFADLLRRGDLAEAQRLLDIAEREEVRR